MAKKVHVVFELTMPNRGSWNGRWSGENQGHYIFKDFSPAAFEKEWKEKIIGSWCYTWDDGWTACIASRVVDGTELRNLRKQNAGFLGYDWMVKDILAYGKIKPR